jgi:outer membrane protein, heavy metal efflux system
MFCLPWPALCFFALAGLTSIPARAQETLSLETAIEMARRTHPLLQASAQRVSAAEFGVVQARLRPNPRLYLQTENWRAWGTPSLDAADQTDTYAYLSQPLETGGKRASRTALARASAHRAELERELVERQVVTHVKQAYWTALGAVRVHQAFLSDLENFRQIIDYHEKRVREGALPEADLIKVRLEGERLQLAANNASLEAERATIELYRAMGQTEFPAVRFLDPLEPSSAPPAASVETALENRTELKLARQAREEASANVSLQKSASKSDVDVLFGYKRTAGQDTLLGGVQYNLPFSNRNQGGIGSAEARVRVADSDIAAVAASIRAEVKSAAADVQIRRTQVQETLPKLRAQAQESAAIALAAYREGGADLLRLLDAQRARIEIETLYYRTLSAYRQSVAALETAMGVDQ